MSYKSFVFSTFSIGLFFILLVSGCNSSSDDSGSQEMGSSAQFPRLPAGPQLGFIEGFNDFSGRQEIITSLRREAVRAGMTVGRAQVDWVDLEPRSGVYDENALNNALEYAGRDGVNIFVLLSTLDSEGLTIPTYLTTEDGSLPSGVNLGSEAIMEPFRKFLDWLIPKLKAKGVFGLALGNEPGFPIQDGIVSQAEAADFFRKSGRYARQLDPELAVSFTLSVEGLRQNSELVSLVQQEMDFFSVNFYCQITASEVANRAQWQDTVDEIKRAAGSRQVFFQELGCPAGYQNGSSRLNASEERQAEFFNFMFERFANDQQLRAATVFQLFDWSPEITALILQELRQGPPALIEFADLYQETLETIGLCRWSDSSCRPAWNEFLTGLKMLQKSKSS